MPNTFAGYPLYDPRHERQNRLNYRRDYLWLLDRANSLWVPAGRQAARGWLLMRYGDYLRLATSSDRFSTNLQLSIADVHTGTAMTFGGLAIVRGRCVSRGKALDPNSIVVIEVTDRRGVLENRWFSQGTNSTYNARSPAYPQQFYSGSLLAGAPFTWSQMIADLWGQMTEDGPFPGLPVTPTGPPEEWNLPGVPAWPALCMMLDHIGCYVACDLTNAAAYTIVSGGATDAALVAKQQLYAGLLEDDLEPTGPGSARIPGEIVVYFHRRNDQYGTEETIRRDGLQWSMTPLFSVTVPAPPDSIGQGSAGIHHLWDDFTVRYDVDNNPLAADVTTATTIASERAQQWFNVAYHDTLGSMKQVYTGCLPFTTGSQVDGVCWRLLAHQRKGWQTEIVRGEDGEWERMLGRDE